MPENVKWRSPEGLTALKSVVSARLPLWTTGLHPWQEEPIQRILDGEDVLLCTATGDGKSALFLVPILCHLEASRYPDRFPGLRALANPLGIVITPTKGLGRNIVDTLQKYISALAYDRETLARARSEQRSLFDEITSLQYQVICIDPEHLDADLWRKILDKPVFRQNLIFACLEEGHLPIEWATFRVAYRGIGKFLRGRLSSHTSVFTMTATLEPGAPQTALCQLLGFRPGNFTLYRYSNERLNLQFTLTALSHGIASRCYPQLIPYLNSGRKMVIFVPSLDIATRLYIFLFLMEPPAVDHARRVRVYTALCDAEFNAETLRLMETDSYLQVIIASVALANGVHCSSIDDSISIGFPSGLSQMEQQLGRAGRERARMGRGVVFYQKSDVKKAKAFFTGLAAASNSNTASSVTRTRKRKQAETIDASKAEVLVEAICLNAARNRRWQNPPVEQTDLDCIAAKRPLPCSLCAARHKIDLSAQFPPRDFVHPPFLTPSAPMKASNPRAITLQKKERPGVQTKLATFARKIFEEEMYSEAHEYRPESWFFPLSLQTTLTDAVLRLATRRCPAAGHPR